MNFPWPGTWTIDLCATSPAWDTYLYLRNDCCTSTRYNDDGCTTVGVLSIIQANITTPGVYVATVEAYSSGSGAYVLTVSGPPATEPGPRLQLEHGTRAGAFGGVGMEPMRAAVR